MYLFINELQRGDRLNSKWVRRREEEEEQQQQEEQEEEKEEKLVPRR